MSALLHRRIVVTRPAHQAGPLLDALRAVGAEPILLPLLEILPPADPLPLQEAAAQLADTRFAIFVSPNAVRHALPVLRRAGTWPEGCRAIAVGPGTADALRAEGGPAALVPSARHDSEGVLALPELQDVRGARILIFRGDDGRPLLGDSLLARGAQMSYVPCYRRLLPTDTPGRLSVLFAGTPPDAFVVTSSEAARHLFDSAGAHIAQPLQSVPVIVPHPRIADTVRDAGGWAEIAAGEGEAAMLAALDTALSRPTQPARPTTAHPPVSAVTATMPDTLAKPVATPLSERLIERLNPTLIVALVALGVITWQWVDSRKQFTALQLELGKKLAEADAFQHQSKNLIDKLEQDRQDERVRLSVVETKLGEAQSQQQQLTALYQDLSQYRDNLLLAEAEQMLMAASQQLSIANNPRAALVALEAAQARFGSLDSPRFNPLRQALAKDVDALKRLPEVDPVGLSMRLDRILANVDSLPFVIDSNRNQRALPPNTVEEPAKPWYGRLGGEIWGEVKQLIRIRRIDRPDAPLLPAEQSYFVRENLKLRLLAARTALIQRDQTGFRTDLKSARDMLATFFDRQSRDVSEALTALDQLQATDVNVTLPTLNASLSALNSLKTAQEAAQRIVTPAAPAKPAAAPAAGSAKK